MSAGISSFMAGFVEGDIDEWIYIDIQDQHPDSIRFIHDCEKIIDKQITIIKSSEYSTVEDCIRAFGGFKHAQTHFSPCTNWLKKRVRKRWESEHQDYELEYVWGFDKNENNRAIKMIDENPQAEHLFPLIDKELSKQDVHAMAERIGLKRPIMYDLGYPNNNCIGCVKGGMGYWNRIRKDFPEVFEGRAKLEREVGYSILKQCFLDELDPNRGDMNTEIFPDCSVMCYLAEQIY